jgi:hypothetical protein
VFQIRNDLSSRDWLLRPDFLQDDLAHLFLIKTQPILRFLIQDFLGKDPRLLLDFPNHVYVFFELVSESNIIWMHRHVMIHHKPMPMETILDLVQMGSEFSISGMTTMGLHLDAHWPPFGLEE